MTGSWRFRAAVASVAAGSALFAAWMVLRFGGTRVAEVVDDVGSLVAALLAAVACGWAAWRGARRARRGWALLGASAFSWGLGEAIWCWYEVLQRHELPFPSPADVAFLAAVPLGVAALLSFPSLPARAAGRARLLCDGLLIALGLLCVSWEAGLGGIFHAGGSSLLTQLITLAYPVGDVITATIAIVMLTRDVRDDRRASVPLGLLASGLLAIAVADSAFAYLTQAGSYGATALTDTGWFAGFLLLALAALRPLPGAAAPARRRWQRPASLLLPYLPLAASVAAAGERELTGQPLDHVLYWAAMPGLGLVLVRQFLALRENASALAENSALTRQLEQTVTELQAREDELAYRAFHDPLTSLANRALFRDRLGHAVALRSRHPRPLAVLLLDLDDFKTANDSFGHLAGDRLLVAVAERLRASVRPGDTVARLGGDEFAVLLDDAGGRAHATAAAQRIIAGLHTPFAVDGRQVGLSGSVGIALGDGGQPADDLLSNADVAMYAAKAAGKGRHELFEPGMRALVLDRLELKTDLEQALARDEFEVHYQPIVSLRSGAITGLEALVRWRHPQRGLLAPGAFVDLAEETGLIVPIGGLVLWRACTQLARWQAEVPALAGVSVAVNLSALQLADPGLAAEIAAALAATGLDAHRLVLEITESLLVSGSSGAAVAQLHALKALGCQLAIDDFGTGYSSLAYLQRFPVDILKVDKTFVDELLAEPGGFVLAEAILQLSRGLGLVTVAEGVETAAQAERLRQMGYHALQGYHFSPPLPPELVPALFARGRDAADAAP